ncbi:MAG: TetR/AcrR family transcriptional regulator [Cyanobacteria bacterium REEB67]|nr:TetR/AcrR family transcriptional regulator [Cyanobacteria bacterium REEB67]
MAETVIKKLQKPGLASDKHTVDEILRVATAVFARHGYRNTDVQVIADELGIGKATIYRKFPTKQELFFAAVDRGMERLHEHLDCESSKHLQLAPIDRLRRAIREYFTFFDQNADLVELFFQERAEFSNRPEMTFFVHKKRRLAKTRQFIQELVDSGAVRKVAVEKLSDIFGYALYGCLFVHHLTGKEKTLSQRADDIIEILINDLLSVDGAPKKAER